MKRTLDKNLTDGLLTGDEWDDYEYNLRQEIKELSEIGYDEKSADWKQNTLAYGYLFRAEEMLRKAGILDKYTQDSIKELKKAIKQYDGLKLFLLTLRLATITARAGVVPDLAIAEAEKLDRSKWTREVKKAVIRRAIENIFKEYPNIPKTLGQVWHKFDVVNKGETFTILDKDTGNKEKYKVEKGKNAKGELVIFITGENKKVEPYKMRSLQTFIDGFKTKNSPSTITQ